MPPRPAELRRKERTSPRRHSPSSPTQAARPWISRLGAFFSAVDNLKVNAAVSPPAAHERATLPPRRPSSGQTSTPSGRFPRPKPPAGECCSFATR